MYVLFFILIQLVNAPLAVLGLLLCLAPNPPWLWRNDDDAKFIAKMSFGQRYVYTALRNPVSNFRHIPYISKPGRPLWRRVWLIRGTVYYAMAGWLGTTGYPVLSAGKGQW